MPIRFAHANWSQPSNGACRLPTGVCTPMIYFTCMYSSTLPVATLSTVAGPIAVSYQCDAAGTTRTDGARGYSYHGRERLPQATSGSLQASYSINAPGRRVVKPPNSGAATVFLYDASGQLIAEGTTAGAISTEQLLIGAGLRVGMVLNS